MNTIGLILNLKNPPVKLAHQLIQRLRPRNIRISMLESDAAQMGDADLDYVASFHNRVQFVLALGGDGTFLRAARLTAPYEIPILAINFGHLGFLSELEAADVFEALEAVFDNRYVVDKRTMLKGEVRREGEALPALLGLNDLVVHRGPRSPVLTVHIQVGESYAMSYRGDGVIVSTSTGSTGYALSAGGPIVHPNARAILITPVCPHMLKERPMIVPDDASITIRLENSSACLSVEMDGQTGFPLRETDHVFVKASPYKATFIRMRDFKFFSLLQDKIRNGR